MGVEDVDRGGETGPQPTDSAKRSGARSARIMDRDITHSVSIDFGTAFTGTAWKEYGAADREGAECVSPDFPLRPRLEGKMPTVLLLGREPPHALLAFGSQALAMWFDANRVDGDGGDGGVGQDGLLLFEGYKLDLRSDGGAHDFSPTSAVSRGRSGLRLPTELLVQRTFEAARAAVLHRMRELSDEVRSLGENAEVAANEVDVLAQKLQKCNVLMSWFKKGSGTSGGT